MTSVEVEVSIEEIDNLAPGYAAETIGWRAYEAAKAAFDR